MGWAPYAQLNTFTQLPRFFAHGALFGRLGNCRSLAERYEICSPRNASSAAGLCEGQVGN